MTRMLVVGDANDIRNQPYGDKLEWVSGEEFNRRTAARLASLPMRNLPHDHEWEDGGYCQGVPTQDCRLCGVSRNHPDKLNQFQEAMTWLGNLK